MLIVGSDDGLYRIDALQNDADAEATKLADTGRVLRLRQFDALDGLFAATTTGLVHSPDGETWTDLGVPEEKVYAVGATPDGERLFAGTRPAKVYAASVGGRGDGSGLDPDALTWTECDGFQDLPSRDSWRLPRHENLAQVKDVHVHPDAPERVVAGVEVGGVHASADGGETWAERRGEGAGSDGAASGAVHDDVHELHIVDRDTWAAATGRGLYLTRDAGTAWERLDGGVDQGYFRAAFAVHDGDEGADSAASDDWTLYAAGALANSSTWNDPDADPELFASRGGDLRRVDLPTDDETVTGLTAVDGDAVAGTHRGSVLRGRGTDDWERVASFPVPGEVTGRYTPLTWVGE